MNGLNAALAADMGVTADALLVTVRTLPHVTLEEVKTRHGVYTVTFQNWHKYQEDTTMAERAHASRSKKRREEKRGEENPPPPIVPPHGPLPPTGFERFWRAYPKKVGRDAALRRWREKKCESIREAVLTALARQLPWLTREEGRYTPNPETWLNQGRWKDEPPQVESEDSVLWDCACGEAHEGTAQARPACPKARGDPP